MPGNSEDNEGPNVSDAGVLAEDHVLEMISQISDANVEPGSRSASPQIRELEQTGNSCEKSSITEASPEPDAGLKNRDCDFQSEDEEEFPYEKKYAKLKKLRWCYISLIIAFAVAFLGTLAGLIALVTIRPGPQLELASPSSIITDAMTSYPTSTLEFAHIDGTHQEISRAFADHSLYESFYGVTLNPMGLNSSSTRLEEPEIQRQVALDVALLSRVTSRLRLVSNLNNQIDRVIQVLHDLNINMKLALSVNVDDWKVIKSDILRILNSYPGDTIDTIYVETREPCDPSAVAAAFKDLSGFFESHKSHHTKVVKVDAQSQQANPLELGMHPKAAVQWINSDLGRIVYTNLESPSETSDKAAHMTSWVCNVVPSLRPGIEWYWANAFDDESRGIRNGLFTESREMKPAGLPRCTVGKRR